MPVHCNGRGKNDYPIAWYLLREHPHHRLALLVLNGRVVLRSYDSMHSHPSWMSSDFFLKRRRAFYLVEPDPTVAATRCSTCGRCGLKHWRQQHRSSLLKTCWADTHQWGVNGAQSHEEKATDSSHIEYHDAHVKKFFIFFWYFKMFFLVTGAYATMCLMHPKCIHFSKHFAS